MTKADDIQRLVERIEGASEGSQGALLEDAWEALAAASASFRRFACDHCSGFGTNAGKFSAALAARAFESAAIMLIPDGWAWTLYSDASCEIGYEPERGGLMNPEHTTEAATPALAITAAALRARITERTDDE